MPTTRTPKFSHPRMVPGRKLLSFKLLGTSVLSDEGFQSETQFRAKYGKAFDDLVAKVPPKATVGCIIVRGKELFIKISKPFPVTITNHQHRIPIPPLHKVRAEDVLKQRGGKS